LRLVAGNPQAAEAAILAAIQRDEAKHYFYKSLGWCLLAQHKDVEARRAFEETLKELRNDDGTYDLQEADPDHLAAAYFLDLIPESEYVEKMAGDPKLACFPWFYVAQRREIEGKRDAAVAAYERCVEKGTDETAHNVRALAQWRLQQLNKAGE
jgi:hypothetical protein